MQKGTQEALAECPDTVGHHEDWHNADVVCGGFPCQDISNAGNRAGITAERSGLWGWLCGTIRLVRPKYALVENVAALLSNGMDTVLGDLAEIGYDAEWHCIPASAVGAPHQRDRVWIIADAMHPGRRLQPIIDGTQEFMANAQGERQSETRQLRCDEPTERFASSGQDVADTDGQRLPQPTRKGLGSLQEKTGPSEGSELSGRATETRDWWAVEPDVGRVASGVPDRVDRLTALGNAVVPQIPELIGRAIMNAHNG